MIEHGPGATLVGAAQRSARGARAPPARRSQPRRRRRQPCFSCAPRAPEPCAQAQSPHAACLPLPTGPPPPVAPAQVGVDKFGNKYFEMKDAQWGERPSACQGARSA